MIDFDIDGEELRRLAALAEEKVKREEAARAAGAAVAEPPPAQAAAPERLPDEGVVPAPADGGESQVLLIRPQEAGARSLRWAEWVTPPRDRARRQFGSYLLTLLALALGLALVVLLGPLQRTRLPLPEKALAMGAWYGAGLLALFLLHFARRLRAPNALRVMRRDRRPPVLLLRAFDDDFAAVDNDSPALDWRTAGFGGRVSFEQMLCDLFGRCGPVVAIGRPGEKVPPLGAARFWISDDRWQRAVEELLGECQRVVLVMGRIEGRAGLTWEARQIFALDRPGKVVLVMPPVDEEEARGRWEQYRRLSGGRLPAYRGGELAVAFDPSGRGAVARAAGLGDLCERGEEEYRRAIRVPPRPLVWRLGVLAVLLAVLAWPLLGAALAVVQKVREEAARQESAASLRGLRLALPGPVTPGAGPFPPHVASLLLPYAGADNPAGGAASPVRVFLCPPGPEKPASGGEVRTQALHPADSWVPSSQGVSVHPPHDAPPAPEYLRWWRSVARRQVPLLDGEW